MIVELDESELGLLQDWYYAAAGESATISGDEADKDEHGKRIKAMLDKLGLTPHCMDCHYYGWPDICE